jgi:hypothetical protein
MLTKDHIQNYWVGILHAKRRALEDIETARKFAKEMNCEGCDYCQYLLRHEQILGKIATDLILIVDSLREGMRAPGTIFPRHLIGGEMIYRGVITDDGRYLPLRKGDYREYREEYAKEHGKESAYKMINVVGVGEKAQVVFGDRKAPPTPAQYEVLKDLMVDAQGNLDFYFVYDTDHPH